MINFSSQQSEQVISSVILIRSLPINDKFDSLLDFGEYVTHFVVAAVNNHGASTN